MCDTNINSDTEGRCLTCKYMRDGEFCKKRRKHLETIIDSNTCKYFDISLYFLFEDFFKNTWKKDFYYLTTDFTDSFEITRHLARHYLFEIMTLQEKKLFRVKYYNKAYYIQRTDENVAAIMRYKYIGIRIDM